MPPSVWRVLSPDPAGANWATPDSNERPPEWLPSVWEGVYTESLRAVSLMTRSLNRLTLAACSTCMESAGGGGL